MKSGFSAWPWAEAAQGCRIKNRRFFSLYRRIYSAFAIVTAVVPLGSRCAPADAKPNVVLIVCDDLNDYVTGMDGHPQAHLA